MTTRFRRILALCGLLAAVAFATSAMAGKKEEKRVFEMRTYITHPGRLDALNKRFREHTCALFKKHGMDLVGFWTPQSAEQGKDNTLVYVLAYPSREAAKASWDAFQADPEWTKARNASEEDGKIVAKVISVYMDPTDYSAVQ